MKLGGLRLPQELRGRKSTSKPRNGSFVVDDHDDRGLSKSKILVSYTDADKHSRTTRVICATILMHPQAAKKNKEQMMNAAMEDDDEDMIGVNDMENNNPLKRGQICRLTVGGMKWCVLELGSLTLVAQGHEEESDVFLSEFLSDVADLLSFYLGEFANEQGTTHLSSVLDLVDGLLAQFRTDLGAFGRGVRWISIDRDCREQVDRMLAKLEENEEVLGSALLVGSHVLHGRLPQFDTRMIIHYLSMRPMGKKSMITLPIFSQESWKSLIVMRLRFGVLVVESTIVLPMIDIVPNLQKFEDSLVEANLPIPVEVVRIAHYKF